MRGKWLLLGGVVILAAIAAGALVWFRNQQDATRATTKQTQPQPPDPAQSAINAGEFSAEGKVQPIHITGLKAPIDGTVEEVFADVGSEVYEGQLLVRIRNGKLDTELETATAEMEKIRTRVTNLEGSISAARLEASRAEAEASRVKEVLDKADRTFQRQQMLFREGATPRLTFEKAEKDLEQAKADSDSQAGLAKAAAERVEAVQKDLDLAKKLLDDQTADLEDAKQHVASGELHSPVDGMVLTKKANPGENANPTVEDFMQIATKLGELQVVLEPPPPVLARTKPGQPAMVRIAEATEELPGKVRDVKNGVVYIEFANPTPALIKPGLTAIARYRLDDVPTPALTPPPAAAPAASPVK